MDDDEDDDGAPEELPECSNLLTVRSRCSSSVLDRTAPSTTAHRRSNTGSKHLSKLEKSDQLSCSDAGDTVDWRCCWREDDGEEEEKEEEEEEEKEEEEEEEKDDEEEEEDKEILLLLEGVPGDNTVSDVARSLGIDTINSEPSDSKNPYLGSKRPATVI